MIDSALFVIVSLAQEKWMDVRLGRNLDSRQFESYSKTYFICISHSFVHCLCFLSSLSLESITLSALNWEYCWSLTLLNRLCLNI